MLCLEWGVSLMRQQPCACPPKPVQLLEDEVALVHDALKQADLLLAFRTLEAIDLFLEEEDGMTWTGRAPKGRAPGHTVWCLAMGGVAVGIPLLLAGLLPQSSRYSNRVVSPADQACAHDALELMAPAFLKITRLTCSLPRRRGGQQHPHALHPPALLSLGDGCTPAA